MSPSRAITQILARDPRYTVEAYALVLEALDRAARSAARSRRGRTSRPRHVTGRQLCLAARDLMRERYGLLALYLLRLWGVGSTSDLGEIVYALIASGDLTKTERDSRADFDNVFDFNEAFGTDYRFPNDPAGDL
ncbi:MAG: hypothetical protein KatS3mg108_0523 [Isosphaeraceae bacterium]|jgi:uncharacterized repeat protein (TIGR04138 family)|nr:MAG: hypothetical protein KatS3mg108_0523 [Isosphaeraceae bacterium]